MGTHAHYHPCNKYKALFFTSALLEKRRPGNEVSFSGAVNKLALTCKFSTVYFYVGIYCVQYYTDEVCKNDARASSGRSPSF